MTRFRTFLIVCTWPTLVAMEAAALPLLGHSVPRKGSKPAPESLFRNPKAKVSDVDISKIFGRVDLWWREPTRRGVSRGRLAALVGNLEPIGESERQDIARRSGGGKPKGELFPNNYTENSLILATHKAPIEIELDDGNHHWWARRKMDIHLPQGLLWNAGRDDDDEPMRLTLRRGPDGILRGSGVVVKQSGLGAF
jgi:hypothetical protein